MVCYYFSATERERERVVKRMSEWMTSFENVDNVKRIVANAITLSSFRVPCTQDVPVLVT